MPAVFILSIHSFTPHSSIKLHIPINARIIINKISMPMLTRREAITCFLNKSKLE